jgi:DNA repair protein RecO (recombination protein O)
MALTTTTALCLRKVDFSETSQILTLLSDRLGTVGAIAKGAKRAKSGIGGPLDLMCLYNVVLYDRSRRGTLSILAQAELLDFFPAARESYQSFSAVESIRELLLAIEVTPHDAPAALLRSVKALRALCDGEPPGRVLAHFAWGQQGVMGVEPVLTECVASGIEPSGKVEVAFSLREMGLLSPPHAQHRADLVRVSPSTLAALQALATGHPGRGIQVDAYAGAFTLLAWLVAMQGGRRLRSVVPLDPSRVL